MTTFTKLPWRNNVGHAMVNFYNENGTEADECPRGVLRKVLKILKDEFGLEMKVGLEFEFSLLDPALKKPDGIPMPRSTFNYSDQNDTVVHGEVLEEIVKSIQKMSIDIICFHKESAHGQFEIVAKHTDPLKSCDNALLIKYAIVAVAAKYGFEASFLPKLSLLSSGNGLHAHISLHKNGLDASQGPTPESLSDEAQFFINGMLEHQAAAMMWTASIPNSYHRYAPGTRTSGYTTWGIQCRDANVRLIFPSKGCKNIRFEQRCLDSTCNIYMAIAAYTIAGILGIRAQKPLPQKTQCAPEDLSESELAKREAKPYPKNIREAVDAFNRDVEFKKFLDNVISEDATYAICGGKKLIADHFEKQDMDDEIKSLYKIY